MTPDSTKVIMMCVEKGIQTGWAHAYKYEDAPTPERVQDCIYDAVLYEIFDWFEFDREKNELS